MSDTEQTAAEAKPPLYMVFDVESVGLHGEGFAVGFVVVDETGVVRAEDVFACPSDRAKGFPKDREWIKANVLPHLDTTFLESVWGVRSMFWRRWETWREQGAILCADVCWPVEANFLSACIAEQTSREPTAPYPLLDIASIRYAAGLDPLGTCERRENELPAHNPLNDARQSARLLVEALAILKAGAA